MIANESIRKCQPQWKIWPMLRKHDSHRQAYRSKCDRTCQALDSSSPSNRYGSSGRRLPNLTAYVEGSQKGISRPQSRTLSPGVVSSQWNSFRSRVICNINSLSSPSAAYLALLSLC